MKVLLLMGNASVHDLEPEKAITEKYSFITIRFLPSYTTPLIQPMDQQVISSLRKQYTKLLFEKCFLITDGTNLTLNDFWKDHFNILQAVKLIKSAWDHVSARCLQAAWKPLWPTCPPSEISAGSPPLLETDDVDESLLTLGKALFGGNFEAEDVEELLRDENADLTVEELLAIQEVAEAGPSQRKSTLWEEEPSIQNGIPNSELRIPLSEWEHTQELVLKWHPDQART